MSTSRVSESIATGSFIRAFIPAAIALRSGPCWAWPIDNGVRHRDTTRSTQARPRPQRNHLILSSFWNPTQINESTGERYSRFRFQLIGLPLTSVAWEPNGSRARGTRRRADRSGGVGWSLRRRPRTGEPRLRQEPPGESWTQSGATSRRKQGLTARRDTWGCEPSGMALELRMSAARQTELACPDQPRRTKRRNREPECRRRS